MILIWFIVALIAGGLVVWAAGLVSKTLCRALTLAILVAHLVILLVVGVPAVVQANAAAAGGAAVPGPGAGQSWAFNVTLPWVAPLDFTVHFALDGFSFLLVVMVDVLGIVAVGAAWAEVQERVGFFHFNLLLSLGALFGLFTALDMILFYFFWELSLVPLYFLIGIWGHENRARGALKLFIYTNASGLLMLVAILALYALHGQATGTYTFDYLQLIGTPLRPAMEMLLMLGFFAAFAVKAAVVPFHTWLPDAYAQAPTAGSVILAGLLSKAGIYGLVRFLVPLFPNAAQTFTTIGMALGATSIIYGAVLAFAQDDVKRLVGYTSVSHLGFAVLGVFAWNQLALQGVVMVMLAHGVTTGGLFVLVGFLRERVQTRDLRQMGGLFASLPYLGGVALFLAIGALGLPGLATFVGEFLVLLGGYLVSRALVVAAAVGFILSTVYALWMIQRIFAGPKAKALDGPKGGQIADLNAREAAVMAILVAAILWIGLYPVPALHASRQALETMQQYAAFGLLSAEADPLPTSPSVSSPSGGGRVGGVVAVPDSVSTHLAEGGAP